jgi:hypothetical protein
MYMCCTYDASLQEILDRRVNMDVKNKIDSLLKIEEKGLALDLDPSYVKFIA